MLGKFPSIRIFGTASNKEVGSVRYKMETEVVSSYLSGIKKFQKERGVLPFQDKAAFRLESTLFQTWSRVGYQPQIWSLGQKKTQHVFGTLWIPDGHFIYRFTEVCNHQTFRSFLGVLIGAYYPQRIFLILDNARFHKESSIIVFCKENHHPISLWFLPPLFSRPQCYWTNLRIYSKRSHS